MGFFEKIMKEWNIRRKRISASLACIVVFVTVYLLILPAITLDQERAGNGEGTGPEEGTWNLEEGTKDDFGEGMDNIQDNIQDRIQDTIPEKFREEDAFRDDSEDDFQDAFEEFDFSGGIEGTGGEEPERPFSLTEEKESFAVTASYGEDAELPEDIYLSANEIEEGTEEYRKYYERALDAVRKEQGEEALISYARFFDIAFLSEEKEIEPAAPVGIVIDCEKPFVEELQAEDGGGIFAPEGAAEADTLSVIHFQTVKAEAAKEDPEPKPKRELKKDLKTELKTEPEQEAELETEPEPVLVEAKTEEKDAFTDSISFESASFSVYGIIGTTLEKTLSSSDGNTYRVSVTYRADADIPPGAVLEVSEVTQGDAVGGIRYEDYVAYAESTLDMKEGSAAYIRLFDIKIVDREDPDTKYQPAEGSSVDVRIELADASEEKDLSVVHFSDGEEEGSVVEAAQGMSDAGRTLSFSAESFSVYVIVNHEGDEEIVTPGWNSTL